MGPDAAPSDFPDYRPAVAEGMLGSNELLESGIMGFLGITVSECGAGYLTADMVVRPDLLTPFGNAHGGVVSALVDHALGSVMYPVMAPGRWAATTEFKINLLRPVLEGPLSARAEIIAMSRRTAVVRVDVTNNDRRCAAAQGTVSIQDPR